jgi:hypothetical protein
MNSYKHARLRDFAALKIQAVLDTDVSGNHANYIFRVRMEIVWKRAWRTKQ